MDRLEQMLEFLTQDPNDSFSRYLVALEYASRKHTDLAIDHLVELRKRDPDYVALYYQLGGLYTLLQDWDNAREVYNAGIVIARAAQDPHTIGELHAALDDMDSQMM